MKLKQVTLSGFKSFCDETDLSFRENGITMIVGPNGCGKSNVVDAIRWVLGEQSPRQLRGGAMGDVIFAGSSTRKPINRSEVTLLFDNSDGSALEKYRDFSEIAVTRRLYRNGESEYLINKMPCRLLDIKELFMDTGAAGRSYSIVEQGRVEEFITATPQERRVFMEEAAGISLFKQRRAAAEKKLEQTRQNLLRVQDILAELARQEGTLREQMEKAKAYLALKEQVALYGEELARVRFERSAAACAALEADMATLRADVAAAEQEQARLTAAIETLNLEQTRIEGELRTRRELVGEKEREINGGETRLAVLRQKQSDARNWIKQSTQELEELRVKGGALALLRQNHAAEREAAAAQALALAEDIARREGEHETLQAAHQERAAALRGAQEQLLECHSQLTGIANQAQHLAERRQEDERRRQGVGAQIAAIQQELDACRATLADRQARTADLRRALDQHASQAAALAELAAHQAESQNTHRTRLAALEREVLETRSRLKSLQDIQAGYQGFGESVRELLQALNADPALKTELGVLGPLGDLIQVPAELLDWAGAYLGSYLEVIVVRHAAALPRMEQFAAGRKLGGLRFVALDALPPLARPEGAALADHLSIAPELEALRQALFGAVRILPAGAPALPSQARPGTEWISQDGRFHLDGKAVLTLGKEASPAVGLLRRRQEIEALHTRAVELDGRLEAERARGQALAAENERIAAERQALEQRRNEDTLALKQTEGEAAQAGREEKRLQQVLATLQADQARITADLARYRQELETLAVQSAQWQARQQSLKESLAQAQAQTEAFRAQVEASAAALTERKLEHGRLTSRLEHLAARLGDLDVQGAELERKRSETEQGLEAHTAALAQADLETQALTQQLTALQQALAQLRSATLELLQGFESHDQQRSALVGQMKGVRQKLEQTYGQLHQLELKLTAEQMRRDQWAAQLPQGPARPPAAEPLDEKSLEKRLNQAQAALAKIEGVNLGAPEEYDSLTSRMGFLATEKEDLEKAVQDLEASIRKMNQESRRRFRETFDQVNKKFQELFPRVFGGGEASLVLTDSDDPLLAGVDIIAQPPGKKLQSLNLLSGGEKALTAISLIFSFFLIKPSPFCLLDEVDAPLDDVNVGRFNALIQSMTAHSQFIIITHNKRTMEIGDLLYGVTMEEAGVSKIVSVSLQGSA
jgi:chromosome segregation protein